MLIMENMEVAVYAAISAVCWVLSATVLLPFVILLKYSKFFRDRWFSIFFVGIFKPIAEPILAPLRKKVFDILKENLPQRDASNCLKILEIGVGPGSNLNYYPENSRLTTLDMNPAFESYFLKNRKKFPHIIYDRTVLGFAENMKDIEDSSMDLVITTHVLCSVRSVTDCMREIKRVLKPGGKFLFMEHVAFPKSLWSYSVQKISDPLWKIFCNGCIMTRNIEADIKNSGFNDVVCYKIQPKSFFLFCRPHIYGLATK